MESFTELLKINHFSKYKLPQDILEIIFDNYVVNSLKYPNNKNINNFYTNNL